MKALNLALLVVVFASAVRAQDIPAPMAVSTEINRRHKVEFDEKTVATLKDADSIVVSFMGVAKQDKSTRALVTDATLLKRLVGGIRARESTAPWFKSEREGEFYQNSVPCQCLGDFEFTFLSKNRSVATLSIHHWTHIRSKELSGGSDLDLDPSSITLLYEVAAIALPSYEIKKSNKAPEAAAGR